VIGPQSQVDMDASKEIEEELETENLGSSSLKRPQT
jgi:hypothetical protein